jgi:hypothetical protein
MDKQFIIINSVELERSTETNNALLAEGDPATPRAALVSLRLEMTTYFQRTGREEGATNSTAH